MRVTDLIEHHYLRINAVLVDSRFTGVCVCVCVYVCVCDDMYSLAQ